MMYDLPIDSIGRFPSKNKLVISTDISWREAI